MKKTKKHKPEMHLAYNPDIGKVDREYALEHLKREYYDNDERNNISRDLNYRWTDFHRYYFTQWKFSFDEIREPNPEFSDVVLD